MDSLFLTRMSCFGGIEQRLKNDSDVLVNENFNHSGSHKTGKLYDCYLNYLEDVDFKFEYSMKYTINKDQVEYLVQFRPNFHPEIKYKKTNDISDRYGFYLDIPDDSGVIHKWLILGRNDGKYVRYNVLKCNWLFKFVSNGTVYEQLGILRDSNNYNSGVWSDGFVTSVENRVSFIVPANNITYLINYGMRFMVSDNPYYPVVYNITKRSDVFPLGIIKFTLVQDHYNQANDNVELKICDYYKTATKPVNQSDTSLQCNVHSLELKYTGSKKVLVIGGSERTINACMLDDILEPITEVLGEWKFYRNSKECTIDELLEDYDVEVNDNSIKVKAHKSYNIVGDVLRFEYFINYDHFAFLDFEVKSV